VVLLDVALSRLGPERVRVGHVDHGVRPDSAEDAEFVAALARRYGLSLFRRRLTPPRADEATLRRLRYDALTAMQAESGAAFVLLGHHRDDQAETVLLQLLRRGRVVGMPPTRGAFVRPLLPVPRSLLERHARRRGLPWREDLSNRDPTYLRNRIRRELLPLLEARYRPGIARRLAALAASAAPLPAEAAESARRGGRGRLPAPSGPASAAESAADGVPGLGFRRVPHQGEPVPTDRGVAWFDADLGGAALAVRTARPGDRIRPFGMTGRKKVFDVFQEHRVPTSLRTRWPLVLFGSEVVWVPGLVRSTVGPIGPATRSRWEMWTNWE